MSHSTSNVVSLLPVRLDLLLVRGTANPLLVTLAHPETEAPYDITLDTIVLTVRDGLTGSVFLTKSNGPGSHSDPEAGQTILDLTAADLADATHAGVVYDYQYEIRRVQPSGAPNTFFAGIFRLKPTPGPV